MSIEGTVLIVDDDPQIIDTYTTYLRARYTTRTAYDGHEALESLDEDVDVVLLDRKMPDVSGDEILARIEERGLSCSIAMVTGMRPELDIVDMGFDDYLLKPVSRDELQGTVESLLKRSTYDSTMREYFALVSKRAVLEQEHGERELNTREELQELSREIDRLETVLDDTLSQLDTDELFRLLER